SAMSTISSPGIGSGLDVQSIVTQLVALERKPIDDLQTKAATIQTQLSSFGLLQSYTTNLRDIADRLSKSDFWTAATASSSDPLSVSATAADPAVAASPTIQTQAAQNAQATINGLAVTSASNTLDGVVDGVTLTLAKETTAPVDVRVALDTASLKKGIADFAKAFSDMNTYISAQTKYDAATRKAAALQGDRPTLSVQSTLRNVFL